MPVCRTMPVYLLGRYETIGDFIDRGVFPGQVQWLVDQIMSAAGQRKQNLHCNLVSSSLVMLSWRKKVFGQSNIGSCFPHQAKTFVQILTLQDFLPQLLQQVRNGLHHQSWPSPCRAFPNWKYCLAKEKAESHCTDPHNIYVRCLKHCATRAINEKNNTIHLHILIIKSCVHTDSRS